jgi:Zn-dependent metalloprotease
MTENLVDLELLEVKESPAGYHVGFRQVYEKIPVWRSEIVVSINHQNRAVMVINGYKPNISINNIPTINQEKVLQLAKKELKITKEEFFEPPTAELLVFPDSVSHLHLVWHVKMYPLNPDGAWRLMIDAHSGEVLEKADIRIYYVNGEGRSWDPDPVTKLQNTGLTDQNDANYFNDSDYAIRTLQELNNAVGGIYKIQGKYAKSEQLWGENPTLAQESNPLNFKYYRNDKKFEEVNVYYHIDKQRRYIGTLGFSPSWNGNTWIRFDAHGPDDDISWYNPDPIASGQTENK